MNTSEQLKSINIKNSKCYPGLFELCPTGRKHTESSEYIMYGHIPEHGRQIDEDTGFALGWFSKNNISEFILSGIDLVVLCEESQEVTKAFRKLGVNAFSCDTQECSGGHPEWHIKGDAIQVMKSRKWDMIIAHPPCTFMSKAGARFMHPGGLPNVNQERLAKALRARDFFMEIFNHDCEFIGVENPRPLNIIGLPKHTQEIQPWQFGHPYSKATRLWLKGFPELAPTRIVKDFVPYLPSNTGGKKKGQKHHIVSISQKDSSKTFPGIAEAMAKQWTEHYLSKHF